MSDLESKIRQSIGEQNFNALSVTRLNGEWRACLYLGPGVPERRAASRDPVKALLHVLTGERHAPTLPEQPQAAAPVDLDDMLA